MLQERTSWSHSKGGKRGAQTVSIYGSNHPTDSGWNLGDSKRYKSHGTISTKGQKVGNYAALSLRANKGNSLGKYRWIVWQVRPVSKSNENTAFQELAVEVVK